MYLIYIGHGTNIKVVFAHISGGTNVDIMVVFAPGLGMFAKGNEREGCRH